MPGRNFLFVPGPTNVPDRIRHAMDIPTEDHRAGDYPEFTKPLFEDIKKIFRTETGQVFIFPSSGTGGWEAAITNTLSPGDKVLQAVFGQFSHLWADLCKRLGMDVTIVDTPWGEGVPLDRYREILEADSGHEIKAVLVTHNETATGVTSDVAGVRKILNDLGHPAMLYVDGVSAVGSIDFRMDEWEVDICVSGSQKGLMLPTGLGIVCVSQKALAAGEQAQCKRCYFDFADMIKTNKDGWFPYTPAMTLIRGLRESLNLIEEEGLDNIFLRHTRYATAVRAAISAWGLKLCATEPKWYSNTVSAVMVPDGVDSNQIIKTAYDKYNLSLGLGLSVVAGKLFRIGHIGDLDDLMVLGALSGVEMAMKDCGLDITAGSGVGAAMESLRTSAA